MIKCGSELMIRETNHNFGLLFLPMSSNMQEREPTILNQSLERLLKLLKVL